MHTTVAFIFLDIFGSASIFTFLWRWCTTSAPRWTKLYDQHAHTGVCVRAGKYAKHCKASRLNEKVGFSYGKRIAVGIPSRHRHNRHVAGMVQPLAAHNGGRTRHWDS